MKVNYEQVVNQEDAYNAAKKAITPELIDRFKVKADISYDDTNKIVKAKGKGFDLNIQFNQSDCDINLDLSFLLKPLKSKVLETIEKQVKRIV